MRSICDAIIRRKLTKVLNLTTFLVLTTLFVLPVCNAQQNDGTQSVKPWAQFRNSPAHTGEADEQTLSSGNVPDLMIQWKGITTGPISSSPAVVLQPIDKGNHHVAYVASQDGYLYAFNADNCHLGNQQGGGQECPAIWKFFLGKMAVTSPAVADELIGGVQTSVVYIVGGDGYLYAINALTGKQIWTIGIGGPIASSSPAVVNGMVYVLSGGTLGAVFAFDAANGGSYLWAGVSVGSASPAVANGMLYVGDQYGTIRAYDANGCGGSPFCSPLGSLSGFGAFRSSAAVSNGRVFVGSDDNNLYVFEAADASCKGICGPLWSANLGSAVRSSPAVSNGIVYVTAGSSTGDGLLYAFDANCSGPACSTPLWTGDIHGSSPTSSPVVAGGVVYVGSDDGNVYAFNATGCKGAKTCSPLVRVSTHDQAGFYPASSPTVIDGYVYVGSADGTLYLLGTCGYVCRYDNQSLY